MSYSQLLNRLQSLAEPAFADFQRRLIFTKYTILGVRTPELRKIAREWKGAADTLFDFPDEVYEVVFLKLAVAASLPYADFLTRLDDCLAKIDNWGLCDTFKNKSIAKNRQDFLSRLPKLFATEEPYYQRFVLVNLLSFFVEEPYLPTIANYLSQADTSHYYVYMAAAWLLAEVLVKCYDHGVKMLCSRVVDDKTHNKAIQKATESYRLLPTQKDALRLLRIKNKK